MIKFSCEITTCNFNDDGKCKDDEMGKICSTFETSSVKENKTNEESS